ncbi:hypothetical protein VMCG_05928 [Cytospora schulzeri]|uniref:HNH domain-containing protein n=1 Tax=Cytospora schulzeri TaxID=448051 RepID=A0A423WDC9_9PEZI|nr:hypothetical protein VMCG_05928 [Valsa malicola]
MPVATGSRMSFPMRSGPGPPNDEGDRALPSVELIDLTGLSTDDENEIVLDDEDDSSGDWEDVTTVIDLTNLPSDDEDEAVVEIPSIETAPTAPAQHGQRQRARHRRAETCELCDREARYDRGITKHHLYPQSVVKAAPKDTYNTEQKNSVALLCWPCHSAIHRIMSNNRLAASYHSVPLLKTHVDVQSWIRKMQRATTAELDPPNRRKNRVVHVATRASKRKAKLPSRPSSRRPLPSQRPDEYLSRFGAPRRSERLAGNEVGGKVSDFGSYSASQVAGVKKSAMTKKQRKLARKVEKAEKLSKISQALDTLWAQNGKTFPKLLSGGIGKRNRLRDALRNLTGNMDVQEHEVRYVLRSRPEYLEWYEWAFSFEIWAPGEVNVGALGLDGAHTPGVQEGDGGTQVMEAVQPHREGNDDQWASDVEIQESIKALEELGDYIPL